MDNKNKQGPCAENKSTACLNFGTKRQYNTLDKRLTMLLSLKGLWSPAQDRLHIIYQHRQQLKKNPNYCPSCRRPSDTRNQLFDLSDFIPNIPEILLLVMEHTPIRQGHTPLTTHTHQCETTTFHCDCGHISITRGCRNSRCKVVGQLEVRYANGACRDCLSVADTQRRRRRVRVTFSPELLASRRIRYRRMASQSNPEAVHAEATARYDALHRPCLVYVYYSLDSNANMPSILGDFKETTAIHTHECGICTSDFEEAHDTVEAIVQLPCGHLFGRSCIEVWLTEHDSCPFCRTTYQIERSS